MILLIEGLVGVVQLISEIDYYIPEKGVKKETFASTKLKIIFNISTKFFKLTFIKRFYHVIGCI